MGVLSDVFIARPTDITDAVFKEGPGGHFPRVEGKGLFPDSFEKLWRIIDPNAAQPFDKHWLLTESASGNSNATIYSIPSSLVTALVQTSAEELKAVKIEWLYNGKPPTPDPLDGIIKDWFEELFDLLREANERNLISYVWLCP